MRILYFGSYDSDYARNRVLIKGLRIQKADVIECRDNGPGFKKFLNLFLKHRKLGSRYDVMIVGFLGHVIMPFAKLITSRPIIFDAFVSLYDSNVFDRRIVAPPSFRARYYWLLDWFSMRLADVILFDTQEHINYAAKEFKIPPQKFRRIFVGTDTDLFYPRQSLQTDGPFKVYFQGSFIPLQGIEYIVKAAKQVENQEIEFTILGSGQTYFAVRKLADDLGVKNIKFIERVSYDSLPNYIASADICLGIFGDTAKTRRVIPNKVYEYAAMAKPIITADTPAIRELFNQDDLLLIKSGDPKMLADAILQLKNDPAGRTVFARNAYKKFVKYATPEILGQQFKDIIQQL